MTAARRVAVTGLGVLSAVGTGPDAFWEGLCGTAPVGPRHIHDFEPGALFDSPKEARRVDRFAQLALAAADQALAASGPLDVDPERRGVVVGTGIGGLHTLEDQIVTHHERGARRVSPFLVPMMMPNAAAAAISMRWGWQGPCETVVTACAAGTQSIARGAGLVAEGVCDVVVAGASESAITPVGEAGFANMTALSSSGTSRPFDVRRDGFVMGEGAAVVVLEDLDLARSRGGAVLAEVLGWASTADAHHLTAPAPEGRGARRCMELALRHAGIDAGDVAHVNAHGTSTPRNDAAEASAIAAVFGGAPPPVTSVKGVLGHALGAAGALEAVAVVTSFAQRALPPTVGFEQPDPDLPPLDVVRDGPRPWEPGPTLSNSFGFGGHNGCLVLAPPADR